MLWPVVRTVHLPFRSAALRCYLRTNRGPTQQVRATCFLAVPVTGTSTLVTALRFDGLREPCECPLWYSQDNCRILKKSRSRRKRHGNINIRPIYAPCRAEIIVNRTGDHWRPRDDAGPRDSSGLLA